MAHHHHHHSPHMHHHAPQQFGYGAQVGFQAPQVSVSVTSSPFYPAGMFEKQIVRDRSNGAIYRLEGGRKQHFPNGTIYGGHGSPAFVDFDAHILAAIPEGPNVLPPGLFEEQVVRDQTSGAIYKLIGGKKCHYSTGEIYASYGSPAFTNFDSNLINSIPSGPAMPAKIGEGAVVRDAKTGAIYRIINGKKAQYPNMAVYQAHGSPAYVDTDASILAGFATELTFILPPGFQDGQIVRNQTSGAIYRIVHGRKCHFVNGESYAAHGSPAFTNFDAASLDRIPDGFSI